MVIFTVNGFFIFISLIFIGRHFQSDHPGRFPHTSFSMCKIFGLDFVHSPFAFQINSVSVSHMICFGDRLRFRIFMGTELLNQMNVEWSFGGKILKLLFTINLKKNTRKNLIRFFKFSKNTH